MEQNERTMLEGLFDRLGQAQAHSAPRDPEAESLLRDSLAKQPAAPYYMAQVILVQEHLLENLKARVDELEQELVERPSGGSFLGSLFGGGSKSASADPQPAQSSSMNAGPFQSSTSGFLGGALQTAAAVAGGVLIGNAIAGLFPEEAQASEAPVEEKAESAASDDQSSEDESFAEMDEEIF